VTRVHDLPDQPFLASPAVVDACSGAPYPLWAADSRGESVILLREAPAEAT
jgi:hypothetical protein